MKQYRAVYGIFALMLALLALPAAAHAGEAWSTVTVNQWQTGSSSTGVDMQQTASAGINTVIDGQAQANAAVDGAQVLWFQGNATQQQQLTAGGGVTWDSNTSPSATTAASYATLAQNQQVWSAQPIRFGQGGTVNTHAAVGSTHSASTGTVNQANVGTTGDAQQSQSISGQSQAQGTIYPPQPVCSWSWCTSASTAAGQLVQTVTVSVQNVFTF